MHGLLYRTALQHKALRECIIEPMIMAMLFQSELGENREEAVASHKSGDDITFTCDECDRSSTHGIRCNGQYLGYKGIWNYLREEEGWRCWSDRGQWRHACGKCSASFQSALRYQRGTQMTDKDR